MTIFQTVVLITICIVAGIGLGSLIPYIKDFKVTPEEKAKVQDILLKTAEDLLMVATSKDKETLSLAICNIVIRKLEQQEIRGFREEDILRMSEIVVDRLYDSVEERRELKTQEELMEIAEDLSILS